MRHSLIRRAAIAVGATALALPFAAGAVQAAPSRHVLPGSTPAWAKPANRTGAPAGGQRVSVQVNLNLRNAAAAERYATAVSTPGNAAYGHYLSPAAFNRRYAPTDAQVRTVGRYLTSQGLDVSGAADGNRWINATGTVEALNKAFDTTLATYRYDGHALRAPARRASVPSGISALVMSVSGLTTTGPLRQPLHARVAAPTGRTATPTAGPNADKPPASTCSTFWDEHHQTLPAAYGRTEFPTYICGYGADQLQSAYGVKGSLATGRNGSGVTIAITDAYASPTMKADANQWSADNGVATFGRGQYAEKIFKPFAMQDLCGGEDGWNGEEAIDVEAAHGLAPGAKIQYVGAKDCDTGLNTALNWVIQHHSADIVSNSWGNLGEDIPAGDINAEHTLFVQAAAEGIGMYFSSGDSGDEVTAGNTPSAQPDFPASDPYVTAVGGTSLAVSSDNSYLFETGWGNAVDLVDYSGDEAAYSQPLPGYFYAGAGGGTSTLFAQPAYQRGVVPDSLSRADGDAPARVVPDVAALADPYTGMAVGRTIAGQYTVETWGGTSLACPLFAGVQADASTGRHHAIGFANPLLYSLRSGAYRDILPQRTPVAVSSPSGSGLITFDRDSSLATAHGYDDVTGLGTPRGTSFLRAESRG